jgi:hypothetical protein
VPHRGGATVQQLPSARIQRYFARDWVAFVGATATPPMRLLAYGAMALLACVLPALKAILQGDPSSARERLRGLRPNP